MPSVRIRIERGEPDPDPGLATDSDATTKFVREGQPRHSPPKARTTGESELPSVMVESDAWNERTRRIARAAVLAAAPHSRAEAVAAPILLQKRREEPVRPSVRAVSLAVGGVVLGLGLAILLFFLPWLGALFGGAVAGAK